MFLIDFFKKFGKQIEKFVVDTQSSHYGQIDSKQNMKILNGGKEARIIPAQSNSFIVDGFYQSVFGECSSVPWIYV